MNTKLKAKAITVLGIMAACLYCPMGNTTDHKRSEPVPDAEPYQFAQKERDKETGLDYSGARYYSAVASRFLSPDPALSVKVGNCLSNPQKLNLYAYCQNRALTYVDPTGNEEIASVYLCTKPVVYSGSPFSHLFFEAHYPNGKVSVIRGGPSTEVCLTRLQQNPAQVLQSQRDCLQNGGQSIRETVRAAASGFFSSPIANARNMLNGVRGDLRNTGSCMSANLCDGFGTVVAGVGDPRNADVSTPLGIGIHSDYNDPNKQCTLYHSGSVSDIQSFESSAAEVGNRITSENHSYNPLGPNSNSFINEVDRNTFNQSVCDGPSTPGCGMRIGNP